MIAYVILGLIVLAGVWALMTYNGLVRLRQEARQADADIDVQLKLRADLIPNLIETVKGYAAHEKSTFDAVIAARNAAFSTRDPEQQAQAQAQLSGALGRLMALAEILSGAQSQLQFSNAPAAVGRYRGEARRRPALLQ